MAITPWSWNASNGTATAAETRAAYNALVGKDLTSKFSYKVWNDLVSKVYEVNRALNRQWKTDYATYSGTRVSRIYDELTEARFNSIRFNTNYPAWRWNYDTAYEGYIGRLDVRGVAGYGDSGADIVYGVYILELAERLNTVIGIINGTGNIEEAETALQMLLVPDIDLSLPGAARFDRLRHRELLTPRALLNSENLPTLTLHFVIQTAGFRAKLESEHLSSMMEGYAYISTRIDGRLDRLPPVSLRQVIRSHGDAQALLRQLSPAIFAANATGSSGYSSELSLPHSGALSARSSNQIGSSASGAAKPSRSIGWHHVRIMLEPEAGLTQEIKKILEAIGVQRIGSTAGIIKAPSNSGFKHTGVAGSIASHAEPTLGVPHLMQIHHDVSTVEADANIRVAQFMESLCAEAALSGPSSRAKLEYDHISTMLRAYLSAVLSGRGEMDKQITGPMNAPVDITVTVPAEAVSDYAPKLACALELLLSIQSEAHTAKAGHGIYHERFSIIPSGVAHTGIATAFDSIRQDNLLSLLGTLTRSSRSFTMIAHGRYGHSFTSNMEAQLSNTLACAGILPQPSSFGFLDLQGTESAVAIENHRHEVSALLACLSGVHPLDATSGFSVISSGELGYILYADLAAITRMILTITGDIEAEGGRWQYPVIVGTDAAVFQVWLTERNREHLFFDPNNGVHHAEIRTGVSGTIDRQIRADATSEVNQHLLVSGNLHKRQRGNWEYPVLSEGVLLITQAIDAKPAYQYKLEVN